MKLTVAKAGSSMPKKSDSWMSCIPGTPIQREDFVERCAKWLLEEATYDEVRPLFSVKATTRWPKRSVGEPGHMSFFSPPDAKRTVSAACVVCGEVTDAASRSTILGNPFSPKPMALMCASCARSVIV